MNTGTLVTAIAVFLLAGGLFFLGVRQLLERGYLFNNAWIYATKKERESMNKKPYYRQSGVVFCLLGLLFTVIGFYAILRDGRLLWLEAALAVGAVVYAVVSSIRIENRKAKNTDSSRRAK
ncbi:MAG: DUF3784 domain-containing protein [Oscillospiraceae bacterium]|nr:DUF3784 domain-containing protein [Oscillospiraceae bacterium]MBR7010858.1 DUF3784 domain-containing protein [Oscillospiraceae bacterium]